MRIAPEEKQRRKYVKVGLQKVELVRCKPPQWLFCTLE